MPYSLKDAAEATGTSKPTILRAIQKGKISADKDAHGEWKIEPSELHRVYPVVTDGTVHNVSTDATWNDTQQPEFAFETKVLRGEVEQLREQLARLETDRERERRDATDQVTDLRRRLDQSEQERRDAHRQITALLTDQREKAPPAPPAVVEPARRRWWQFGRANG